MLLAIDALSIMVGVVIGLVAGLAAAWMKISRTTADQAASDADYAARLGFAEQIEDELRERIEALENQQARLTGELTQSLAREARLTTTLAEERAASAEKLALLERAQATLADSFKALSAEALSRNNQSFLTLARETLSGFQDHARQDLENRQSAIADLVQPVRQSLEKMDGQIQELEVRRAGAYEGLREQVRSLLDSQTHLRTETSNLVRALRTPSARGRWGEIQLKRVCEMAGMLDHCDFYEQTSVTDGSGQRLRPDLTVRLPGGKTIVVDAKTPLEGYLDGTQGTDETARATGMARHARHVRDHMRQLSGKAYWDQFKDSPEFVVLFLPGENFFSAALEQDPSLIEAGIDHRVILATPTTLIALLRAVAYGWRQERLADNAREISALGAELYKRISDMAGHMDRLGGQLGNAVTSYNKAVGTLESRVLVSARRLRDLQGSGEELPLLDQLDHAPRQLTAQELRGAALPQPDLPRPERQLHASPTR